jgi:zinc protease
MKSFARGALLLGLLALAWRPLWAALPIEHWTADNGARVYLVQSHSLPMLDVQVDVDAGSRRDPAPLAGLAQATALMWARGVAADATRAAIDENALVEAWTDLGAQFAVQAGQDRMSFTLRTLTDAGLQAAAVALAARQLSQPAFPAAVWARERERLAAAWREAQTQPAHLAERAFAQAVYGGHPYGREATPETWAAMDVGHMRGFAQRHVRACDARVTLVGAIDRSAATELVRTLLAGWSAQACAPQPSVAEVAPLPAALQQSVPFQAAQAQILVGQPGLRRSDPDFLALLVGNHILGGGGFTSRLMQELREKRGLTYGVYSTFAPGRHAGAFTVGVQTRPDQAAQTVALVQSELRRFVAEGPTEAELRQAQSALVQGFALRLDSNRKLLDNVASLAWNDLPLDYLDTWTQQVAALSREQVTAALQRVLQPDRMVTVVLGATP